MCKPRVNRGVEHDNVNVGIFNIEEETSSTGISGWLILEYITFFIIIFLGVRLLSRLCKSGCRKLNQ